MLQETTGYIICRTARKIHQFMTRALADYDITPEQWVVLHIVSKEKNLSQQDLSERLEKDITAKELANFTQTLTKLEEKITAKL